MLTLTLMLLLTDGSGATKAPAGYPDFLPYVPGGIADAEGSKAAGPKSIVLTYAQPDTKTAEKIRAVLKKDGWAFDEDVIPGMSGQRFSVTKGAHGAYFTIKPLLGDKKKTQVIVTDTSGAAQ